MLWEQTQDKTGGGHRVEHDGGDALSQLANAEASSGGLGGEPVRAAVPSGHLLKHVGLTAKNPYDTL
jgi:hypothetical protein